MPSDSPDDFATISDLRKKPEFYKINRDWVSIDPIPVLTTPTYGELTAPRLVERLKIQSQKDVKQLAEAKEIAYKEGFYSGVMLVGEFKGLTVQEAKPKVRASMIEQGLAFAYAEPENPVISRSADECVVALMDQWYMDYGEPVWRSQAERLVFCVFSLLVLTTELQVASKYGDVDSRDSEPVRGHLGMAESVGMCSDIRLGV